MNFLSHRREYNYFDVDLWSPWCSPILKQATKVREHQNFHNLLSLPFPYYYIRIHSPKITISLLSIFSKNSIKDFQSFINFLIVLSLAKEVRFAILTILLSNGGI